jgi:opacity protein-like surface antigen
MLKVVRFASLAGSLVAALCVGPAPAAHAAEDIGSMNFVLGAKLMDTEWSDLELDTQSAMGVEITWARRGWPVWLALDALATFDDARLDLGDGPFVLEGATQEVSLGLRRSVHLWKFYPYLGAGGTLVRGRLFAEDGADRDQDSAIAFGWWAGGGVVARVGPRWNVGAQVRYSQAKLDFDQVDLELEGGGMQVGLLLGWDWPARP